MDDFFDQFLRGTTGNIYLCSLPNPDSTDDSGERALATRDLRKIPSFLDKWDKAGRGLFFSVGVVGPNKPRNKENISEVVLIHADTDAKDISVSIEEAVKEIAALPLEPSRIHLSGRGVHSYWFLEAPTTEFDRVEALIKKLCAVVGGDRAVTHIAALMRVPGSHNTKDGAWTEVLVHSDAGHLYTLEELEDWLDTQAPVLVRKSSDVVNINPFLRVAESVNYRPPLDVDERLAAMEHKGEGDAAIHTTQLSVTASLMSRGEDIDEVVKRVLDATKQVGEANWDWKKEERVIRRMCEDWERKNRTTSSAASSATSAAATGTSNVVSMAARAASGGAQQRNSRQGSNPRGGTGGRPPNHVIVGQGLLASFRDRGIDILTTETQVWRFNGMLWALYSEKEATAWLNREIDLGYTQLGIFSTQKLVSEAKAWILRSNDIYRETVDWDSHGKIPTRSGLLDPYTLQLEDIEPDHFATYVIEAEFDTAATCPWWEHMLESVFRKDQATMDLVQEIAGVALLEEKPKTLMRALVLVGQSNSGKSNIIDVLSGLLTDKPITANFDLLENPHGTSDFLRRAPWVLHEAFDQSKWHFSSRVKELLSGDPININIKNGPQITHVFRSPVFWGTNAPPQFKEASKAIENRIKIVTCRNVFDPDSPSAVMVEAQRMGFSKPSEFVLATERSGILNWAIAGMQRALKRGHLLDTEDTLAAAKEMRQSSNPVEEFFEEACEFDCDHMVSNTDFYAAYSIWWEENYGKERRLPSPDLVGKSFSNLYDRRLACDKKEMRFNQMRYRAGFKMNELGLSFWQAYFNSSATTGGVLRISSTVNEVNRPIPESWDDKEIIKDMRAAHHAEKLHRK